MLKYDAQEAAKICEHTLTLMLGLPPTRGRAGSDFRTAVGDFLANAEMLLQDDQAGPRLDEIFDLARNVGISQSQLDWVCRKTSEETPRTLGGILIQNALIKFALATEARIIADMEFVSRSDVEALALAMNGALAPMEEIAADDMDQAAYQALVALHAAISYHLAQTARPLPRMLNYAFAQSLPSLVLSYRLYADGGRADELRVENKIVHPAFSLREGRALSA
jgi:prophage DNA circulation protein